MAIISISQLDINSEKYSTSKSLLVIDLGNRSMNKYQLKHGTTYQAVVDGNETFVRVERAPYGQLMVSRKQN